MRLAKPVLFFLLYFSLIGPGTFPQNQLEKTSKGLDERKEILKKTAEYCEKLKKVVFDFVCHENIREKIYL